MLRLACNSVVNIGANPSSKAEVFQNLAAWETYKLGGSVTVWPFFHLNALKNIHASEMVFDNLRKDVEDKTR